MEKLGSVVSRVSGSLESQRSHADLPAVRFNPANLPAAVDKQADVDIPRQVWSAWIPAAGQRELRRALTPDERGTLVRRAADLAPALAPYHPADIDEVMLALADMFGAFPTLRLKDAEALGKIESGARALAAFPAWAIKRACETIRTEGYFIDADGERKRERHWPPSDPDIVAQVKREMVLRKEAHDQAVALLSARVEDERRPA